MLLLSILSQEKLQTIIKNNEVLSNEGELVIFPSQLNHGYDENTGYNRISLSMNFIPTIVTNGDYGWRCVNLNQSERKKAFDEKEGLPNN